MFRYVFFLMLCFVTLQLAAQNKTMPDVELKTLEGKTIALSSIQTEGKIRVYSFWATWCSPCKKELDAINDYYAEWKEKYNMELVAVSIDDARTAAKIPAMVHEKEWEYIVLHDANLALKTAAGINSVPYTILVDAKGIVVYEHTGYVPGDEIELEEKLKELNKH
jgi:cytochrome c biogenesis protein CcmG, thiol:disulfide interchange protein DsbE